MGERSQIFVRYEDFSGHKILAARYFQYNSDASMVSRARGMGCLLTAKILKL